MNERNNRLVRFGVVLLCAMCVVWVEAGKKGEDDPSTKVDLTIKHFAVKDIAFPGETLSVATITKNLRNKADSSVNWFFLCAGSNKVSPNDFLGSTPVRELGENETVLLPWKLTIPVNTPTGEYQIICVADGDQFLNDVNRDNNAKSVALTILKEDSEPHPIVNLTITNISLSTNTAARGATITVIDATKNLLNNAGSSTTYIYLTTNTNNLTGCFVETHPVGTLTLNQVRIVTNSVTIPMNAVTGANFLVEVANGDWYLTETVKSNNTNSVPINITQ